MEGRSNTDCSPTTAVKYTEVVFPSPCGDVYLGTPLVQAKFGHKRTQSCEEKSLLEINCSKVDHDMTQALSKLKDQRKIERSWSAKERRASMGAKFSSSPSLVKMLLQ